MKWLQSVMHNSLNDYLAPARHCKLDYLSVTRRQSVWISSPRGQIHSSCKQWQIMANTGTHIGKPANVSRTSQVPAPWQLYAPPPLLNSAHSANFAPRYCGRNLERSAYCRAQVQNGGGHALAGCTLSSCTGHALGLWLAVKTLQVSKLMANLNVSNWHMLTISLLAKLCTSGYHAILQKCQAKP